MHFVWFRSTSLRVFKFVQIKEGGPNFWGEPILQNVWIIWSPLLYFNFKSFLDPNSSPFISFQCILYDSGVLLSESWNFYKLKRGDLISGGKQFCRKSELFGPPFCISILKVLWTKEWFPKILVGQGKKWKWFTIQIICSEMHSTVCANTHHDATTLEVDDMIWNIKILIY